MRKRLPLPPAKTHDTIKTPSGEGANVLIGISPVISPELLDTLFRMGHGDELVLADAFFPGDSTNARVIRADGIKIPALLDGILTLMNLDSYVPAPLAMMALLLATRWTSRWKGLSWPAVNRRWPGTPLAECVERFAFYERAKRAFAVVMTNETVKYGNIILKKGVIPVS